MAEKVGFLDHLYIAYKIAHKYKIVQGEITMHINKDRSYTNGNPSKKGIGPLRQLADYYHLKLLKIRMY